MSVFLGIGYGVRNLPTTRRSPCALYSPTVVANGVKSDPVTLSFSVPGNMPDPDLVAEGLSV